MFDPCVFTDEVAAEFPDAVRTAVEAGARQMEIRGRLFGRAIQELDSETAIRVRQTVRELGAGVGSLGSPVGKCHMDDSEELRRHDEYFARMLDLTEVFECPIIRGFSLWAPNHGKGWDRDLGPHMDRIAEFLLPKASAAAERGAVLALENEWDTLLGSCEEAKRILEHLGTPPGLGLVWDFGNSLPLGEEPYPDGYELIEPWIVHVHVKPNAAGAADPLPGDGAVGLAEALTRLWNDGYEGAISVEHFPGPEKTLQAVRDVASTIARIEEISRRRPD